MEARYYVRDESTEIFLLQGEGWVLLRGNATTFDNRDTAQAAATEVGEAIVVEADDARKPANGGGK